MSVEEVPETAVPTLEAFQRPGRSAFTAALRFPLGWQAVSTVLLGASSFAQLETAAAAVARGPLDPAAFARPRARWAKLAAGG